MKKFFDSLFSMQLTVILLLMFAISAGMATFIENDFGTSAARLVVYNATWFEIMLVLLAVNLGGSIIVNKLWQRKKYFLFAFHASFIIILIGASITRYFGTEGMLHIREGEASNQIVSDQAFVSAKYFHGNSYTTVNRKVLMSGGRGNNNYSFSFDLNGKNVDVETVEYVPNASMVISKSANGQPIASFVVVNNQGKQTLVIKEGDKKILDNLSVSFAKMASDNNIALTVENGSLVMISPVTVTMSGMQEQTSVTIPAFNKFILKPMLFYQVGSNRIVLRSFEPSGEIRPVTARGDNEGSGLDAIRANVSVDGQSKEVFVWGKKGIIGQYEPVEIGGLEFGLAYGSTGINLPFKIRLNKFILERYPGSMSPSSYASEVTLIDESEGQTFDFRIFMNHILKHRGYRFYQSSYDNDEKGTILSVNYDGVGITVTYIGYFIMTLAMILALFSKRTRFGHILKQINETRKKRSALLSVLVIFFLITGSGVVNAGETKTIDGKLVHKVDKQHAARFGRLMVLSANGRIEPMNTLNGKIMRKFTGKSSFEGFNADQLMLGIVAEPEVWQQIPLLKVKNSDMKRLININGNYASFAHFFKSDRGGNQYILSEMVNEAYQKESSDQTRFDKEVMNVDEKVNIFYMVYSGGFMKLFPKTDNPGEKWYDPTDEVSGMPKDDSLFVKNIVSLYANALATAFETGDYSQADQFLGAIESYQKKYAPNLLFSEKIKTMEITYNNADIFERLFRFYGMFGVLFLIVLFINLVNPKFRLKWLNRGFITILAIAFLFHTLGFAARWYISGHAPLSNGYESMIFIAWAAIFAGFLFVRKLNIALAAATVLASLTLFVAHLNWMNPEVTNLVPVLKSIWLTIHVAVITSSYAFLGLGAILGLFNLLLMIFQNRKNTVSFSLTIKEISFTSEATMTIGLYMLTIGTFLGAVWANESWGRYWGWDPKETWALVTVLVYAVIIHMNFIPGLMGRYLFNALSVLGFSSVLMTYFGVNYYLSGLHSYAAGDPVPIPTFVYYTIAILVIILVLAFFKQSKLKQLVSQEE